MNKFLLSLLVPLFLFACAAQKPAAGPVSIPDPGLAAAIAAATGQPANQLPPAALKKIVRLRAPGRGIKNLDGIQFCSALRELELSGNQITDLSPLAALRDLVTLDLSHNQVVDLTPLSRLLLLTNLRLQHNQIIDITPLARNNDAGGLPCWTWIYLDDNPLGTKALETDIPYLVAEGVTITYSEQAVQATRRPMGKVPPAGRWPRRMPRNRLPR